MNRMSMEAHLVATTITLSNLDLAVDMHDIGEPWGMVEIGTSIPTLSIQIHKQDDRELAIVPFLQLVDEFVEFGDLNLSLDIDIATPIITAYWVTRIAMMAEVIAAAAISKCN